MSKKFLFLIPPQSDMSDDFKKMKVFNGTIPYGVLSIITYVNTYKKKDVDFDIIDFNTKIYEASSKEDILIEIENKMKSFRPDIIGISATYNFMFNNVVSFARYVKSIKRDVLVIAGGACTHGYLRELLERSREIDAICCSEGEIPILDLINSDNFPNVINNHKSFITLGKLMSNFICEPTYVENLDDIPPIDYSYINISHYGAFSNSFNLNPKSNGLVMPICTTRGCPYNCVFCNAGSLHGKKLRYMSAERVISDVKLMIEKYGMTSLTIVDDQFLALKDRTKKILKEMEPLNIHLRAENGLTVSFIDDEMASLLKKAGLDVAWLAIESGSEHVLKDIINKPIDINYVPIAVSACRKNGLLVYAPFIIGFPDETEADRQTTIDFIKNIGIDWSFIYCATPAKGSKFYDICVKNNYINENEFNESNYYKSVLNTSNFTAEYITKKAYLMNLELNFVNNISLKNKD